MTPEVNAAVLRAHTEGVLTSASLMVAEPTSQDAVEIARRTPTLGVGLHLTVTADHSLLPRERIPHLAGPNGRFETNPIWNGLRFGFSKAVQAELRLEMEAQFDRFAQTGLPWSHADGHQHFHMHPAVWKQFLDLCDQYGVNRLRLPTDDLWPHLRGGGDVGLNLAAGLILHAFVRANRRRLLERGNLGGQPPFFCERLYGTFQSGNLDAAYFKRLPARLGGRTNEVHLHPGTRYARPLPPYRQREGIRDVELEALLDPAVRASLEAADVRTGTYEDLERDSRRKMEAVR